MANNLRQLALIMILFGSQGLLAPSEAHAISCRSVADRVRSLFGHRATVPPPDYACEAFDIRVVSAGENKNVFNPKALKQSAINALSTYRSKIQEQGFVFPSFVHVFVEAHSGAIRIQRRDAQTTETQWLPLESPFVANGLEIGLPRAGQKEPLIFKSSYDKRDFPQTPSVLIMSIFPHNIHSLESGFIVAHELLHLTENMRSHTSKIWSEARSDLGAYLLTGTSSLSIPIDISGGDSVHPVYSLQEHRRLSNPEVTHLDQLVPDFEKHHTNSQILSAALFDIGYRFGKSKILDFIHWMDRIEDHRVVRQRDQAPLDGSRYDPPPFGVTYIYNNKPESIQEAIASEILAVGTLIRQWGKERGLEEKPLESILARHGI